MSKNERRKNGEGCVYQRTDGRWAAEITTGNKRKTIYGSTYEEVANELVRARNQQLNHIPFTSGKLTTGQWLETWLRNMKPPATAPKTWVGYEYQVRAHLKPELGHIPLIKLAAQDVRDFLSGRLDSGLSARTVKHLRATLRAALNQAVGDNLLQRNVAQIVKAPEVEARLLDVYTPEEARILIEAAGGHRLEALFTAAVALGLRMGECLGLQWTDIDFTKGILVVRHSLQRVRRVRRGDVVKEGEAVTERLLRRPKGKKIKSLPLPRTVLEALKRHKGRQYEERLLAGTAWKGDGSYVFTSTVGTPLEQRRLDREFKMLCDTAGLRRIRFHDLRHSAASILIAQGVHPKAICELLRHCSIQLTMDVYGHLFKEMQQETADKMDAALGYRPDPLLVEAQTTVKTTVKSDRRKPN